MLTGTFHQKINKSFISKKKKEDRFSPLILYRMLFFKNDHQGKGSRIVKNATMKFRKRITNICTWVKQTRWISDETYVERRTKRILFIFRIYRQLNIIRGEM